MHYWVERRLEFKTVPARWEIAGLHETLAEAEARAALYTELLNRDRAQGIRPQAKGGGTITEYRVYCG